MKPYIARGSRPDVLATRLLSMAQEDTPMSRTDDRADKTLPVTAEVGDEGGSYADPTIQADTFSGPAGNPRVDTEVVAGVAGEAAAVASQGEMVRQTDDEVRHATEPPEHTK